MDVNSLTRTDTQPYTQTFELLIVCAHCSHSPFFLSYLLSCSNSCIIHSTSRLCTYRINNATVKPITCCVPKSIPHTPLGLAMDDLIDSAQSSDLQTNRLFQLEKGVTATKPELSVDDKSFL